MGKRREGDLEFGDWMEWYKNSIQSDFGKGGGAGGRRRRRKLITTDSISKVQSVIISNQL